MRQEDIKKEKSYFNVTVENGRCIIDTNKKLIPVDTVDQLINDILKQVQIEMNHRIAETKQHSNPYKLICFIQSVLLVVICILKYLGR